MSLRLRPRFDVRVDATPDEVMDTLRDSLREHDTVLGHRFTYQYEIYIPEKHRHFWSPFLNILVREEPDGTHISGRFGPNVNVWTMFMAAYVILGMCAMTGAMIGVSQMTLKQPATGYGMTALCMVLALVVYGLGKIGEKLATPQIESIRKFCETTLGQELDLG